MDEEDAKRIVKERGMRRIKKLFDNMKNIDKDYSYLFKENLVSLGKRSTQYLNKWIASVRMAECVMERRKSKKYGKTTSRGRRGRSKKFQAGQVVPRRGGDTVPIQREVRPYLAGHQQWVQVNSTSRGGIHTRDDVILLGRSGRPYIVHPRQLWDTQQYPTRQIRIKLYGVA